jgi:hypothetical protein
MHAVIMSIQIVIELCFCSLFFCYLSFSPDLSKQTLAPWGIYVPIGILFAISTDFRRYCLFLTKPPTENKWIYPQSFIRL